MPTAKGKDGLVATSRLLLGGLLLLAGAQKWGRPDDFRVVLANYKLLPVDAELLIATALPRVEVVVGLCLLIGILVRAAAALGAILSLGFGVFVTSALARELNVECGCFSGASRVSWQHLGLDGLLLTAALAIFILGPDRWALERLQGQRRRFGLSTAALLLLCTGLALHLGRPAPEEPALSRGPAIVFDPPQLDLGRVAQGETVERTVSYRNVGSDALAITWVQSSCRCTVPQPTKKNLLPGEAAELNVQYHVTAGGKPAQQTVKVFFQGHKVPATLPVIAEPEP